MLAAIIFDMDGVLIEARNWHFQALNSALEIFGFTISQELHELKFNGLPTRDKLNLLSTKSGLPVGLHGIINGVKQEQTLRIAAMECYPKAQHLILLAALQRSGIKIGVATNSIRLTAEAMLTHAGIISFIDVLVTNEDVVLAKPSPEIYQLAMSKLKVNASQTLVIEDNWNGITAAKAAGCLVLEVESPREVHIQRLEDFLGVTFQ